MPQNLETKFDESALKLVSNCERFGLDLEHNLLSGKANKAAL